MLVAGSSAVPAATDPPRNARECGLIIDDIVQEQMAAGNSPTTLAEFLKSTNVDKILEKLCAEGRYEEAYRVGQGFLGGKTEPSRTPTPNTPECIKAENGKPWSIDASADRYVISRLADIKSFDEKRIRNQDPAGLAALQQAEDKERVSAGIGGRFAIITSIANEPTEYVLSPYFASSFRPERLDVVLRTADGQEQRGTVPVRAGNSVLLTELMTNLRESSNVEITASLAGQPVFSATFEYLGTSKPKYQGMVLAYRLKDMRDRGACHDRPCFLTTACCELIGLPDDCFELRALRQFRDRVMAISPDGARDIAFYYEAAPLILDDMEARGARRHLLAYYATHILPCALMARAGLVRPTYWLYRDLMRRLCRRYGPGRSQPAFSAQHRRRGSKAPQFQSIEAGRISSRAQPSSPTQRTVAQPLPVHSRTATSMPSF